MSGFDHKPHPGTPEHDKQKSVQERMREKGLAALKGQSPAHHDSSEARKKAEEFYKARAAKKAKCRLRPVRDCLRTPVLSTL